MTTPSNAAKAASVLHHTWGVTTNEAAIALYDRWMVDGFDDPHVGFGVWEPFEALPDEAVLASIEALALSIDQCREELPHDATP